MQYLNQRKMYKGTLPPLAGKGSASYFMTDDIESYNTIIDLGKTADAALRKIEKLTTQVRHSSDDKEMTERRAGSLTKNVLQDNESLQNRIIFLEFVFKDLLKAHLNSYPIELLQSKEGDEGAPLNLQSVVDHWLARARIKLQAGEKLERKFHFKTGGSF